MSFHNNYFYLFYIFFFNIFEKIFFFFKINNDVFSFFSRVRISFFLDPLNINNNSIISSISFFLLNRLFFFFPKWEKVIFIRRLNRFINKRRRFISKIIKGMFIGNVFFLNNIIFFNYLETLCRYSLPFYSLNLSSEEEYVIKEYFILKKLLLFDNFFNIWIPRVLFHFGNEFFFEYFFFFFESSFCGLNMEIYFDYNHLFFQKILLSHLGLPIN